MVLYCISQLFIYDGTSSDLTGELGSPKAHTGGIYAVSTVECCRKIQLLVSNVPYVWDKSVATWPEATMCE